MSRHEFTAPRLEAVIGWDRPNDEDDPAAELLWIGTRPGEIRDPRQAMNAVAAWLPVPADLVKHPLCGGPRMTAPPTFTLRTGDVIARTAASTTTLAVWALQKQDPAVLLELIALARNPKHTLAPEAAEVNSRFGLLRFHGNLHRDTAAVICASFDDACNPVPAVAS
jgi:hypothetical protein